MSRSGATTGSKQLTSIAGEFPPITPIIGSRLEANHVIELSVSNVRFREKSGHGLVHCICPLMTLQRHVRLRISVQIDR
jgi:hypothetical protein